MLNNQPSKNMPYCQGLGKAVMGIIANGFGFWGGGDNENVLKFVEIVALYSEFTVCVLSCVQLFETPWTVVCQAPLFMEFSRQKYRSRLRFPTPGDVPDPAIKLGCPALAGSFFTTSSTWEVISLEIKNHII